MSGEASDPPVFDEAGAASPRPSARSASASASASAAASASASAAASPVAGAGRGAENPAASRRYGYRDLIEEAEEVSSMSSGISPRGASLQTREPLDLKEATNTFRSYGRRYGTAATLRKQGVAPYERGYGVVDDLPSRLAFEQLNTLSGITAKMQRAILHNKEAFQRRVAVTYKLTLRQTFIAWQAAVAATAAREGRVAQAQARLARSLLSRRFFAWRYVAGLTDPTIRMKNKAKILLARGIRRRVFGEWFAYVQEESYRDEKKRLERAFKGMQHVRRGCYARMVAIFAKQRLWRATTHWSRWAAHSASKRRAEETALTHLNRTLARKTFAAFRSDLAWKHWKKDALDVHGETIAKLRSFVLRGALVGWKAEAKRLRGKAEREVRATRHRETAAARLHLAAWSFAAASARHFRVLSRQWQRRKISKAFWAWIDVQSRQAERDIAVLRRNASIRRRKLADAFYAFCDAIVDAKNVREGTTPEAMEATIAQLMQDNAKLRAENARYAKFVDTSDLGRGRMRELSDAVTTLQSEKNELKDLVGLLRQDYEAMSRGEGPMAGAGGGPLAGGGGGYQQRQRVATESALQRNKMLVKGGSSFNALIRALKQDLVDSRRPKVKMGDENLLYEVDRLSLDEVTVMPDGELKVKAIPNPNQRDQQEIIRYKTKPRKPPEPAFVPTGGRSKKLGSQTLISSALTKLSTEELGKLEKYLEQQQKDDATAREGRERERRRQRRAQASSSSLTARPPAPQARTSLGAESAGEDPGDQAGGPSTSSASGRGKAPLVVPTE